jgi:hypothetical protein
MQSILRSIALQTNLLIHIFKMTIDELSLIKPYYLNSNVIINLYLKYHTNYSLYAVSNH